FSSSMAGEIFALLCNQSVLKHSVSSETYNIASFVSEAEQAMRPDGPGLLGAFAIRAEDLLHDQPPENGLGKLSGMLIGSDVAARRTWLAEEVVILGEPELSELYQIAIEIAGAAAQCVDSAGLTLSGLRSVHQVVVQDEAP
ncbi:MAG: 2-dehydro-3-deoxygalactonokinase, partial [Pseudomonadota bacterium]